MARAPNAIIKEDPNPTVVELPLNWVKINKKRHSRGYNFEHQLVIDINAMPNWYARRLGGSSTGLPDIVAVNNKTLQLFAIEAKSIMNKKELHIPKKEVQRCLDIARMFEVYKDRWVLFSFKFSKSSRRVVIHHFLLGINIDERVMETFEDVVCDIEGRCFLKYDGRYVDLVKFYWDYDYPGFKI